ncbi:uncharacterized protein LOC111915172 [Lactuca sativa]|uniref:uncharacterized protein LOC111915172 n=1 Tax=Lactuca sativa TaxID=4236 RepID=UPI000CD88585|nr:uncharacterized protein LOC111915172 [Lactuca sativa]
MHRHHSSFFLHRLLYIFIHILHLVGHNRDFSAKNMASVQVQAFCTSTRKVHLRVLVLYALMFVHSTAYTTANLPMSSSITVELLGRRMLEKKHILEESRDVAQHVKQKSSTSHNGLGTTLLTTRKKNKSELITANSAKNLTKPFKLVISVKNSTKTNTDSSFQVKPSSKKTNSTKPTSKTSNLTKPNSVMSQKSIDPTKKTKSTTKQSNKPTKSQEWSYQDDEEVDFVDGFRDLPSRFQETLLPDLEVLSMTSKVYLKEANKDITNGVKPIVGTKYAPTVASIVSFAFIMIPFVLVSVIFSQIKAYFSLQKLLIFIQIYLSIYFSILCLTSLVTGLEPLKFFYATSQSTYICIQLLQTLSYVLYLLVLLMYFVLVFSTETGIGTKLLAFGQMFVGFAVGFHYYMTVFHRAVLHQPPKTSWKFHAIYATCNILICLLDRAGRRKKAYVMDGSEEGKMS